MSENGYIKFSYDWTKSVPLSASDIADLERWRTRLRDLRLIGANPNGTGYGNISRRIGRSNQFIITGSNTGHLATLGGNGYTRVLSFDLPGNKLECEGPIQASSESLTHAAVYLTDPEVNAVFHVHSLSIWQRWIDKLPTTSRKAEYGTPEMAEEMVKVLKSGYTGERGVVVMGGHQEGLVSFGKTLDEAGEVLLYYCQK
jgi:L-ribulose-5-phosphate 4-epimerase